MNLARMMTHQFFIEGRSGMRSGPFKTKFGGSTLMVFDNNLHVVEGDRIIRPLPDGSEQVYITESCALNPGSRNIPSHFAIRIAEQAATQGAATSASSTIAHAAPLDVQRIAASLQSLAQAIEQADFPLEQKNDARAILRTFLENPVVTALLSGVTPTS